MGVDVMGRKLFPIWAIFLLHQQFRDLYRQTWLECSWGGAEVKRTLHFWQELANGVYDSMSCINLAAVVVFETPQPIYRRKVRHGAQEYKFFGIETRHIVS